MSIRRIRRRRDRTPAEHIAEHVGHVVGQLVLRDRRFRASLARGFTRALDEHRRGRSHDAGDGADALRAALATIAALPKT